MEKNLKIPIGLRDSLIHFGVNPLDLVIYITSECNLRCKHCYMGNKLLNKAVSFDGDSIIAFLENFEHIDRLTIIGGEPLLHESIDDIIKAIKDLSINEKRITTNLTFIDKLKIHNIKMSGIRICASVDGHLPKIHDFIRGRGSFNRTISNLEILIDQGVDIEIIHTINSRNIAYVGDFVDFIKHLGIKRLNLHKISPHGNALDNPNLMVEPIEWIELTRKIESWSVNSTDKSLLLRYPILFMTKNSYNNILKRMEYKPHAAGSFYSLGSRVVICPNRKLYISSEAFGTESYIGRIQGKYFVYNNSIFNELNIFKSTKNEDHDIALINREMKGDKYYPIALSVSFKRSIQL